MSRDRAGVVPASAYVYAEPIELEQAKPVLARRVDPTTRDWVGLSNRSRQDPTEAATEAALRYRRGRVATQRIGHRLDRVRHTDEDGRQRTIAELKLALQSLVDQKRITADIVVEIDKDDPTQLNYEVTAWNLARRQRFTLRGVIKGGE